MDRPANARYTKSHEWIVVEGDVVTLGITDFAVEHLSDLVFVNLPETDAEFAAGDTAVEIESVKAVAEVYAPVSGSVAEVNTPLVDNLDGLGTDPFGEGWLLKIRTTDLSPLEELMDAGAYAQYLETAEPS